MWCEPVLGDVLGAPRDIAKRAGRLELSKNASIVVGAPALDVHVDVRHAVLERRTDGRQHHVFGQRRFELVEERGPRKRPLLDQPVGLLGRGGDERQLVLVDAASDVAPPRRPASLSSWSRLIAAVSSVL